MSEKQANISQSRPRNTNLELFRILTMLLIIAHHYVVNSGLTASNGPIYRDLWSVRSVLLLVFGAFGKTGINCFVLITGYFMCTSKITAKKFAKLLLEVEFYKIALYLIFVLTGYQSFSVSGFAKAILPFTSIKANFVGCFLVFYLLIPFLNVLLQSLCEKQHLRLLLLLVAVYVGLGTLLGGNITMNYVTWFVVLYVLAAYIRLYPKPMFQNTKFWGVLALSAVIISALSVVAGAYLVSKRGQGSVYFLLVDSNKILAVATALCGFMFFKNVNIKSSKFINAVAASAFGVLLIHSGSDTMRTFLWNDLLKVQNMYGSAYLALHAILSVIGIYAACTAIDYLRILLLERPFFRLWDKLWPRISEAYTKVENKICKKLHISKDEIDHGD